MYSFGGGNIILSLEINRFEKTILQKPGICCIFDNCGGALLFFYTS